MEAPGKPGPMAGAHDAGIDYGVLAADIAADNIAAHIAAGLQSADAVKGGQQDLTAAEQVFFPGPYYPKPWLLPKAQSADPALLPLESSSGGGSSSGKRVRPRSVKGDEFDKRGVEMQSDDDDDDDDEDEGPSKKPPYKPKREPKKKDKSELKMDPAFHWCYGAPKDYAKRLADGSFQQGWMKIRTKTLAFPSGMENGRSTWDWSAFERNIQEKKEAAAALAAQGEQASFLSVLPWCHQTMTIKTGNYYMLANEDIFVQAIGLADEAGMFKAAVWPKYVQLQNLIGSKPRAEMMNTSSIGWTIVNPNL